MNLKKYKLESFFYKNPKSFLILQLLPIKENNLVKLVQKLNTFGFEVIFLKSKTSGGIFKKLLTREGLNGNTLTNIFSNNLVLVTPLNVMGSDKNGMLNIEKQEFMKEIVEKAIILGFFYENVFYHYHSLLNQEKDEKKLILNFITTYNQNAQNITNICKNPLVKLVAILQISLFKALPIHITFS